MSQRDHQEHIRFSLADTCVDGEWHRVSFNRIFSRIFFVFAIPIAFVLCRKQEDETYRFSCRSVEDPLLRRQFDQAIEAAELEWREAPDQAGKYLIPLFETDVSVLLLRIVTDPHDAFGRRQQISYEPVASGAEVWKFVRDVVRPFGPELPRIGINVHIKRMLDRSIEDSEIDDALWQRRFAHSDHPGPISAEASKIIEESSARLRGMIDRRYRRIAGSPIMTPNGRKPANILFFNKVFDRVENRFGAYHYDCRPIIGEEQWADLVRALDPKRFERLSDREWGYTPESDVPTTEVKPRYPVASHDRAFWKLLRSGDGPQSILKLISSPLGRHTRLCVEYVATSGTVLVIDDPFRRGALGWIDDGETVQEEDLRLVCMHYVLLVLGEQGFSPCLLLLPLRANGAPWMVAATVRGYQEAQARAPGDAFVTDHWFQRSYLMYHSLMRPLERRLRQSGERLFCEQLADMFMEQLKGLISYSRAARNNPSKEEQIRDERAMMEICLLLNRKTHDLCRCYPLERVKFFTETQFVHNLHDCGEVLLINDEFRFYIGLEPNPFFDRLQLGPFLRLTEIRDLVWERVVPWIEGHRYRTARIRSMADVTEFPEAPEEDAEDGDS